MHYSHFHGKLGSIQGFKLSSKMVWILFINPEMFVVFFCLIHMHVSKLFTRYLLKVYTTLFCFLAFFFSHGGDRFIWPDVGRHCVLHLVCIWAHGTCWLGVWYQGLQISAAHYWTYLITFHTLFLVSLELFPTNVILFKI